MEETIEKVLRLPPIIIFTYLMIILALFIPGFGILYLSEESSLKISAELIILAVYYSVPYFILGFAYSSIKFIKKKDIKIENILILASVFSLIVFYATVAVWDTFPNTKSIFGTDQTRYFYQMLLLMLVAIPVIQHLFIVIGRLCRKSK